ncbi:MAG: hypothetical protein PF485_13485 [Bacteroidales bacterium]|jgi:membrane-associated phospholipid phosphatase|nr:hypothetical protein [Bacteroidales bacterium]
MGTKAARIFSILFHPLLLPSIGIIILYNSGSVLEYLPFQAKKIILLVVAVSTFVLPLTFVPFFIFQKIIKNMQMQNNKERLIPFFVSFALYFFCFYLLRRLGAPQTITKFILAASCSVLILFLLSFKWKISAHATGIGGFTGALIAISFRLNVNLEYFIITAIIVSGIVGYSRLMLKSHEPYQIYIGWLTGFCTSLFIIYFF